MELKVTSIEDLQRYGAGQVVELPPFAEDMPFVARLKRPSMLAMMKSGMIPNSLLSSANALFTQKHTELAQEDDKMYSDIFTITEILAESALLDPTYQQIKESGLELTDEQCMALFNYTQVGVKALENFRKEQTDPTSDQSEQPLQSAAQ